MSIRIDNAKAALISKIVGFDLIGFAKAERLAEEESIYKNWLKKGRHAGMKFMERNYELSLDPKLILPSAKSVIVFAVNYNNNQKHSGKHGFGKISRYAWGDDYHIVIKKMLEDFHRLIKSEYKSFEYKSFTDAGPVMEKAWAMRAGLGWIGKNSSLITKKFGGWIFLSTSIVNAEFEFNERQTDRCGTCDKCIRACPTEAIMNDRTIDSNKCISYLTIENKGEINFKFKEKFDNWIFGCDICQEVCPWNIKNSAQTETKEFLLKSDRSEINLQEAVSLSTEDFKNRFKNSSVLRAKHSGFIRNAKYLL